MVAERSKEGQHAGVVAVLFSAGLDSAVLLAHASAGASAVQPLYVSVGLAWELDELAAAERLVQSGVLGSTVRPVVPLRVDMRDEYPEAHWAVRGDAPGFDTPDEDVYLEGRNIVLLSKAAIFMARSGITRVMIGPLAGNPFPDATPAFFAAMQHALTLGLGAPINIEAPFAGMRKSDVIRLGLSLGVPLELSLSCMQPSAGAHCGRCSKCRERQHAFADGGFADFTRYANREPLGS
ncbi:MAG: 7-cyano-7-deazaguanine synthase [Acidobacteria bacterium]|nr:7-cyano-7-deazaguanine synthase [Acidobacteriota bacterium]MBA3887513.1 7-cyano-7-deazaguanine synthase [Acidobacteriota bacterium]